MRTHRRRKKYRITSKVRFITSFLIMFGLLITGFNAITGFDTSAALTRQQYTHVEISSGDTLWELANQYKADDTDPRKAVHEICRINDIDASELQPGMIISIPENL